MRWENWLHFPRTDRVRNGPYLRAAIKKRRVGKHADVRHRGRSACELPGWLKREAWGMRGVTPTSLSRYPQGW
mgnify:CR=1 FL=1